MAKISVWKSLEVFNFQTGECISKNVPSNTIFFEDTDTLANVCKNIPMMFKRAYKINTSKPLEDTCKEFDPDEIVL